MSISVMVVRKRGGTEEYREQKVKDTILRCATGLDSIDVDKVVKEANRSVFHHISTTDIENSLILATRSFIELDPDYSLLAARIFLQKLRKEVFQKSTATGSPEADVEYRKSFVEAIKIGVENKLFDARMAEYDLEYLAKQLTLSLDDTLHYISVQTLYERYFTKHGKRRIEMPQSFWMRVAMGLALGEAPEKRQKWALEFYRIMSNMLYIPSTPTLFHAGTSHPQLSSCFLGTIPDDLKKINESMGDNAQLSKWSGGVATDYGYLRASGAFIKTTQVDSQGVIPFLKIENDWTIAINRSGKRRGAKAVYLPTYHLDIEDFLDLRKNTGDERRRTPDMDTVNWIPDLFMKRYIKGGAWTLFSPDEVPDLHDLYGKAFEERYEEYELKALRGEMRLYKTIPARRIGRKMLQMMFESGHPWWTFKDPCNIRSPQDHCGVVHSSNLCTEITLNTSPDEIAVCNLGSIVAVNHMTDDGEIDWVKLANTISIAMRALDNVIDENFYPVEKAKTSNLKHRPVGLGVMGIQDAVCKKGMAYEESQDFQDELQEFISYHAISGSSDLAAERGAYSTFKGSKWDRGIFPLDTLDLLEKERGMPVKVSRKSRQDWLGLKAKVKKTGLRNSNSQAIAPTATIATIACVTPGGESWFKNLFVKSNMSGEFVIANSYLISDLKKLGMWNQDMLDKIKFYEGSVQNIKEIPESIRRKYKEAFEIDQKISADLTALRGKWIDQSQSFNLFFKGNDGNALEELYLYAWSTGIKTTYYLRTQGISGIEKSTLDAEKYGFTQKRESAPVNAEEKQKEVYSYLDELINGHGNELRISVEVETARQAALKEEEAPKESEWDHYVQQQLASGVKLCKINDPTCDSCQ